MKRLFFALAMAALGTDAYAGCHDKCIIRNPVSGKCAYELRVCPLSTDTLGRWVNGATKVDLEKSFKHLDPVKALSGLAKRLDVVGDITDDVADCVVGVAATGAFGAYCAAGIAEVGPLCFADLGCTLSCMGTGESFKTTLDECSGN
ncbi:MAG: hypothetical protein EOP48_16240 [Sphingobacteriales bacterium]|nr:MAG: hypothetical protein EOP48_16240 [Sphingobacteriales bacterium]